VLTHVDDRFDSGMRDAIGADAARVLPLANRYNCTFLVEDPATVWHLSAERYREIASGYRRLTAKPESLAIDLNIVDRYQNVYPTRQQTGIELFQLVHQAAASFDRVAVYGENSMLTADLALLPSAAAAVSRVERLAGKLVVESSTGVGIPWTGGAVVDGQWWPATDGKTVWLPAGAHAVEGHPTLPRLRVTHFNGAIRSAQANGTQIELSYHSQARAIAVLNQAPARVEVDGTEQNGLLAGPVTLLLPRGQHVVTITSK